MSLEFPQGGKVLITYKTYHMLVAVVVMYLVDTPVDCLLIETGFLPPPLIRKVVGAYMNGRGSARHPVGSLDVEPEGILVAESLEGQGGEYVTSELVQDDRFLPRVSVPEAVVAVEVVRAVCVGAMGLSSSGWSVVQGDVHVLSVDGWLVGCNHLIKSSIELDGGAHKSVIIVELPSTLSISYSVSECQNVVAGSLSARKDSKHVRSAHPSVLFSHVRMAVGR